jgi:hypothetical protein
LKDRQPGGKRHRWILIPAAMVLGLAAWVMVRKAPPEEPAPLAEVEQSEPAPAVPPPERPVVARKLPPPPAAPQPKPLEYMSDGVPIMPAGPDDPHPNTFVHPHPITPQHLRIFRENGLLFQLNEAMDGNEAPRLRGLLAQYRDEYPDDPHDMQKGYALIADCIEHPSDETRAAARRYYDEEIASTLRRFVKRHCLD